MPGIAMANAFDSIFGADLNQTVIPRRNLPPGKSGCLPQRNMDRTRLYRNDLGQFVSFPTETDERDATMDALHPL
jgi:hypothetical protein